MMKYLLLELQSLLEKAKSKKSRTKNPKKYHQDFIDLSSWKKVISHILNVIKIEDNILLPDNVFSSKNASRVFRYLDSLPTLEGISQEQLLELTDYLTEIFNLLLTNQDAKKVVKNLKELLKKIEDYEKNPPPVVQQVSIENPEIVPDSDALVGTEEPSSEEEPIEDEEMVDDEPLEGDEEVDDTEYVEDEEV